MSHTASSWISRIAGTWGWRGRSSASRPQDRSAHRPPLITITAVLHAAATLKIVVCSLVRYA